MNTYRLELKWAIIYTLFLLLWMVLERLLGWHDEYIDRHHIYTLLFYLPVCLIYYLALSDKRNNFYGGTISYKQAFLTGLMLTVFIALSAAPAQYVISSIITPHYFDNVIAYAIETGKTSPDEAVALFNLKSYMIQSVVGSLTIGLLLSALVGVLVKRK